MTDAHFMTPRERNLDIVRRVAAAHNLRFHDIMGRGRSHPILRARHLAYCAVALANPDWAMTRIAKLFGRDHTALVHSFQTRGYPHDGFDKTCPSKHPRVVISDAFRASSPVHLPPKVAIVSSQPSRHVCQDADRESPNTATDRLVGSQESIIPHLSIGDAALPVQGPAAPRCCDAKSAHDRLLSVHVFKHSEEVKCAQSERKITPKTRSFSVPTGEARK